MADRVQVIKQESAALGGDGADELPFDAPIDPQEDIIESAGLYIQDVSNRDETTLIARAGADMVFKDGNNPVQKTLTQLLGVGVALPPATQVGQVLFSADGVTFTVECPVTTPFGWLVNDDGILLVV